jgi:predicted nucleotidyltransferase
MQHEAIAKRFSDALDTLIQQVKLDRAILAAILCGSLAHDTVWARSDIDLVLVTIDDKRVKSSDRALTVDGVTIHAILIPRAEFRKTVEGSIRHSFIHSFLAKGRLLYTHDPTIADLLGSLGALGARDTEVQLLRAATGALGPIDKAHKWLLTRGDVNYAALWILYSATPLAQVEVMSRRLLVDREVIPQAMALNPSFFTTIYTDLLNMTKTSERVEAALAAVDGYLAERAPALFAPVLEHLREVGEARSVTEIEDYFTRHFDVAGAGIACEYLADRGLLGKAATPVRLTKKSSMDVPELAFYYVRPPQG